MSVHFKTKSNTISVPCSRYLNLLAHAQIEEVDLGSECGGHGICGKDRVKVSKGIEDLSPVTEAETRHLTSEELQAGFRLGCQAWPEKDDLEIEIEL